MTTKEFAEKLFAENPTRFKKGEKAVLRGSVKAHLTENGWAEHEIKDQHFKGTIESTNLVIGDVNTAEYIITAHYDTPGRTGFLLGTSGLFGQTGANIVMLLVMLPLGLLCGVFGGKAAAGIGADDLAPQLGYFAFLLLWLAMMLPMFIKNKSNRNDNTSGVIAVVDAAVRAATDPDLKGKCCFVLFDNEEWGLIGSACFAKWCKKQKIDLNAKTNINLDCVGVGDYLCAARTNGKRTAKQIALIEALTGQGLTVKEKQSGMIYMSDHANLKNSYMLCYMGKSKIGAPYIPNIHSGKDTVCDVDKVIDLSDKIMTAIK